EVVKTMASTTESSGLPHPRPMSRTMDVHKIRRLRAAYVTALVVVLSASDRAAAQTTRELSLGDAIALARHNNPAWLQVQNDEEASAWRVRDAYASLLPSAFGRATAGWQEAGVQRIGTLDFGAASTDYLSSSYSLGVSWTLDGGSLFEIASARADR